MKIVYLGTPDFAVPALRAVARAGKDEIAAVVTQPDRPAGRGGKLCPPPVKIAAEELGIPVYQFEKIRLSGAEVLKEIAPDCMVTCAFGQILSPEILSIPRLGTFNIHASLLPKYRGAAPIARAIFDGETETGVTIMRTDAGVDTGDILLARRVAIGEDETAGELTDRLSLVGADAILDALDLLSAGKAVFTPQDHASATHAAKLGREEEAIDWTRSAAEIARKVRALSPRPGAYALLGGNPIKIFRASAADGFPAAPHGTAVGDGKRELVVACGSGALRIGELQAAGGKRLAAADYLRGKPVAPGTVFGNG